MKKKLLSVLLSVAVITSFLPGCAIKGWNPKLYKDTGKVLNIYCWNDEFMNYVVEYYPGYRDNGNGTGTIGNVKVNWIIEYNYDMNYQNILDVALSKQDSAKDDKKVDIFLVEPEYADKYINTEGVCISMKELGLTRYMADQYQYTKDVVTDDEGNIKGSALMASPGVFAYRRSVAKQVFGTDDPKEIQEYFSDWDKFTDSAGKLWDVGWKVTAGYDDSYRVFAQNVSTPWVIDGEINVDENLMKWVEQTKMFLDEGYIDGNLIWSEEWFESMDKKEGTFGYFGPAWYIDFVLASGIMDEFNGPEEAGNGSWGDWAAIEGPAPYYWGGYWICVAEGSDNANLAADIIYQMTCNPDIMEEMISEEWPFCNNKTVMEKIAEEGMPNEFLGGQNVTEQYCAVADAIRIEHTTPYDFDLSDLFQYQMKSYFDGEVDLDEALDAFYDGAEDIISGSE